MNCESCGMPISSGTYCEHCTDENGNLQDIEERIRRMSIFMQNRSPEKNAEEIRQDVLAYLKTMPAWKDHPLL